MSSRSSAWIDRLNETLVLYPCSAKKRRRSRLITRGRSFELAFKFNQTLFDHVDALIVDFIAKRVGAKTCEPSDGRPASVCYRCNREQAKNFGRFLAYASTLLMDKPPPLARHEKTPLSVLLTHALSQFTCEYESAVSRHGVPSLEVLSNVLQAVPRRGVTQKEFERRAVLATRTARVVVRHCVDLGWLKHEKTSSGRKPMIALTKEGDAIRNRGNSCLKRVESLWSERYESAYENLKSSLQTLVNDFELELPNYITGYGPADEALTGGTYLPAEEGPPRVPSRGAEWPVVERQTTKQRRPLSLPALLSQTLTQFVIDYEAKRLGRLGLTALFFQHLPDEGMSLKCARQFQPITGNGKSLHERHLYIAIDPGKPSDGERMVYPTQKTRLSRDAYAFQVSSIESQWQRRYGRVIVTDLRKSLEILDSAFSDDLPDYPNTTIWMLPWSRPFLLKR
ncbi:MAG: hypothetical protein OXG15_17375 [Gammaproteobacteria bacterium]|nr:hypothetical protein [Gammaproteobacteria bacterium]